MNEMLLGFAINIIACFAFGFMFVPLRKFECGDGFFVQWVYSIAVLFVGFIVNCFRGFPPFLPLAMVGGAVSAAGSMAAVPLMKNLGLSVGMMLWGDVQVITGWSIARFGLFGTKPQPVYNNAMNVAGVVIVLMSGVMFAFVRHETQHQELLNKKQPPVKEKADGEVDTEDRSVSRESNISLTPLNRKRVYQVTSLENSSNIVEFPLIKLMSV